LFCLGLTLFNLVSLVLAYRRCRPRQLVAPAATPFGADSPTPPVTIVRPVCGIETYSEETLGAMFELDYPEFEILFCVQRKNDAVIPLVEKLIARYPAIRARLLIGDDPISPNPKLNNCFKGWQAAAYQWIVLADSNVLAPKDYLQRMLANFTPGVGLVCSPPLGDRPVGFWAQVECAFLNSFQGRWQFCADAVGLGFAQGKSMLWRADIVEKAGGFAMLGSDIAEDAAATKLVRGQGFDVRLVDQPFSQPLGRRRAREVYLRQLRWARLRRASFPKFFAPEIFASALIPLLACAYAGRQFGLEWPEVALLVLGVASLWHLSEAIMARALGWPSSILSPFLFLVRDLIYPAMWIDAWLGDDFVWQGNSMSVRESAEETAEEAA
jgi:ceramide glucosyltransferase